MTQPLLRRISAFLVLFPLVASAQQGSLPPPDKKSTDLRSASAHFRKGIPAKIDRQARYLFYLHGQIIENEGIHPTDPRFGVYEYEEILNTFERKGFVVVSEARPRDTDVRQYAEKTVGEISGLLKVGVPPGHITVVGASKGSVIAMLVSTLLGNREVNFVLMSNCNDWVDRNFKIDLHGNVLSIYDVNDEFGRTCRIFFEKATGLNRRKEVELKIGTGHAILYRPLKEWVDLIDEWAKQS